MAPIIGTKENFDSLLKDNEIVFIDFWAEWCGPCKAFAPVFEEAAKKHEDIAFIKVDTEDQPELAQAFGVRAIPTLVAFREQIGLMSQAGALPASALEDVIQQVRDLDMEDVKKQVEEHKAAHHHD
jgi:thioredoxin 1